MAPMREERIAEIATSFDSVVARHAALPANLAAWQAWCANSDLVPGYFPDPQPGHANWVSPLPAAEAFNALLCDMPWDDPEADDLDLLAADRFDEAVDPVCVLVRKGSPVAALFHGIGPVRAQLLPGWLGNFLLSPDEVRALRPQVEEALTLPAKEHAQVIKRVRDWLNGMCDSGDKDADELVSGPLRTWRAAIEAGAGLCAFQNWVG